MVRPLLGPGARVGVIAPSGIFDEARLERGMALIRGWGLDPEPAPGLGRTQRYLAGTDDERLADLAWALAAPGLDGVWLARGGFGLTRLLHRLPGGLVPSRPVIGFSDATALFAALWRRAHTALVHGPVLQSLADLADAASQAALRSLLLDGGRGCWAGREIVPGSASGPVLGGNVCTLASLVGTDHALRAEGAILVLEEVGERPYRVDRLLTQLLRSGAFEGVAAIAFGTFLGCEEPGHPEWEAERIAAEVLSVLGVPVVAGLPIGHGPANRAFVWGERATLEQGVLTWGPAP